MDNLDPDWLGELRWKGYPRLDAVRDVAASIELEEGGAAPVPPPPGAAAASALADPRAAQLARENESLRTRLTEFARLSAEFERRLNEAGAAYEAAVLEAESRLRDLTLEHERLRGEHEAAKGESARMAARDAAREADLRLERERRADAEKALLEVRRRGQESAEDAERLRASASELAGAMAELRRQAAAQNERLLQAKVLTDQDVHLLRQEMREFLAKFHRIQETFGETP